MLKNLKTIFFTAIKLAILAYLLLILFIVGFKYLPKEIQQKYIKLEIVPKYILENLKRNPE